jgi:hypothetical protein
MFFYQHVPISLPLITTTLLHASVGSPFIYSSYGWNHAAFFWTYFNSFNIRHFSRFNYMATSGRTFIMAEWHSSAQTILFIHSCPEGHLRLSQTLARMTCAAVIMGTHMSLWHSDFTSFSYRSNGEIAGSYNIKVRTQLLRGRKYLQSISDMG